MSKASAAILGFAGLAALALLLLAYDSRDDLCPYLSRVLSSEARWFEPLNLPIRTMPHIFDMGVVDADGDHDLDVYTSNHNYRQVLLLNDGRGGYQDVLSKWGLDQDLQFPGWEQSYDAPRMDSPGLYIFWYGETLVLRNARLQPTSPIAGLIRAFSEIRVGLNEGFDLQRESVTVMNSSIPETVIEFMANDDAQLQLSPLSRGVPIQIELDSAIPLSQVFLGAQKVSPRQHELSPFLRDRHGLAWADYDGDGMLDVFISRGGVGGTIRKLPTTVRDRIRDELLITGSGPRFFDFVLESGIEKKDCSGRHAEWVDFNADDRIDLFVNCQDRGKSEGVFPKQLWQQGPDGRFEDVAIDWGLGLTDHELIDFVWVDVDGDGDVDLLTNEDKGFFVYRQEQDKFTPQYILRPGFVRADVSGLKGEVNNYWRFDGKLTAADFESDGDIDVFSSSKRGNVLLVNDRGSLKNINPSSVGLPMQSLNAVWVDYDSDGLQDLYTIPDGLYRQTKKGYFEATGLLRFSAKRYQAAIVNWYDFDNDGERDLLVALNENPSLWRWWQRPFRSKEDAHLWTLHAWRNKAEKGHWLQVEVRGQPGNKQSIGARVAVSTSDGAQVQDVGGSDSAFFSQGHYRLYFGLGPLSRVDILDVRWPDGRRQTLRDVPADQILIVDRSTSNN